MESVQVSVTVEATAAEPYALIIFLTQFQQIIS